MGGNVNAIGNVRVSSEFNFFTDPEAAYVALKESKCPLYIVPWETCLQNKLETRWRREVLGKINSSTAHFFNKLEAKNLLGNTDYIVADQLAMVAAIDETGVTSMSEEMATVELAGKQTRGMMVLDKREGAILKKKNVIIIQE